MTNKNVFHSEDAHEHRAKAADDADCNAEPRIGASPEIDPLEEERVNRFGHLLSRSGNSLGSEISAEDRHNVHRELGPLCENVTAESGTSCEIELNNGVHDKHMGSACSIHNLNSVDGADLQATFSGEGCQTTAGRHGLRTEPSKIEGHVSQTGRRWLIPLIPLAVIVAVGALWQVGGLNLASYPPSQQATVSTNHEIEAAKSQGQISQNETTSQASSVHETQADLISGWKANEDIGTTLAIAQENKNIQQSRDAAFNDWAKPLGPIIGLEYRVQDPTIAKGGSIDMRSLSSAYQRILPPQNNKMNPRKNGPARSKVDGAPRVEPFFPFR